MGLTLPHPRERPSKQRFVIQRATIWIPALALLLAACVPGIMEPPTPFSTEIPPTREQSTPQASPEPEQSVTPPEPVATERVALPAQPALKAGQPVVIMQLWMDSATEGWAIGSNPEADQGLPINVLRTIDGGLTWRDVTPPEDQSLMTEVGGMHSSGEIAWVIYLGTDRVWRTADQGATWTASEAGYPMGRYSTIEFTDLQHGWMLQEIESGMGSQLVALFRTGDGGETWEEIIDPYASEDLQSCRKTGISFFGKSTGWATYDCQGNYTEAFLDITIDGGESWVEGQLPVPGGAAESAEQGWCYSDSPGLTSERSGMVIVTCVAEEGSGVEKISYLYRTEDTGKTWEIRNVPGGELYFFSDGTILALGRDQFLSMDGGENWTKIKSVSWDGQYSFVDPDTGWAVATDEDEIALVFTTDGGRTWEIIKPTIVVD